MSPQKLYLGHPGLPLTSPKAAPCQCSSRNLFPHPVLFLLRNVISTILLFLHLSRGKFNLAAFSGSLRQLNSLIRALHGKVTTEKYLRQASSSFIYLLYSEPHRQSLVKRLWCALCLTTGGETCSPKKVESQRRNARRDRNTSVLLSQAHKNC